MNIEEVNRRLDGVTEDLKGGAFADIMITLSQNAIAMIRDRVQQRGLNPEGQKYREYSKNYLEYKKDQKKYRGFVDFTFTGRMLNNIALTTDKGQLMEGIAVIKPKSQEEQEKLRKNTKQRGKILMLSENEIKEIREDYKDGIYKIFVNNGLGL